MSQINALAVSVLLVRESNMVWFEKIQVTLSSSSTAKPAVIYLTPLSKRIKCTVGHILVEFQDFLHTTWPEHPDLW